MKIAVLGMGSWGTALAQVLAENNHEVLGWTNQESVLNDINNKHTNQEYLPESKLHKNLKATLSLEDAVSSSDYILLVLPVKAMRSVLEDLDPILEQLSKKPIIIHASKGLELGTHLRMSQVIEEVLDEDNYSDVVVLSGPSHAEEVIKRDITTIVAASYSKEASKKVQNLFMNDYFRVYTNSDVIGVEIGAALKNIFAICAGIVDGAGYGDNTKAALVTRGLAEITRFGIRLGADPLTFSGLSGIGDLVVTCYSKHSRNWQAGYLLGQGHNPKEVEKEIKMVVEGISTCKATYELSKELGVEMPLTEKLYELLYGDTTIPKGLSQLMAREGKSEATLSGQLESMKEKSVQLLDEEHELESEIADVLKERLKKEIAEEKQKKEDDKLDNCYKRI